MRPFGKLGLGGGQFHLYRFAPCAEGGHLAFGLLGIGIASLHMNAVPFYVMLISFALGGTWNWAQAAGAAIVVLGVAVAQGVLPRRRA